MFAPTEQSLLESRSSLAGLTCTCVRCHAPQLRTKSATPSHHQMMRLLSLNKERFSDCLALNKVILGRLRPGIFSQSLVVKLISVCERPQ
jgi:hypothetical protein